MLMLRHVYFDFLARLSSTRKQEPKQDTPKEVRDLWALHCRERLLTGNPVNAVLVNFANPIDLVSV